MPPTYINNNYHPQWVIESSVTILQLLYNPCSDSTRDTFLVPPLLSSPWALFSLGCWLQP